MGIEERLANQLAVGGYYLRDFIGAGAAGLVFRADKEDGHTVALKLYKEDLFKKDADAQDERIQREVALSRIAHPGLCKILTHGKQVVDGTSGRYLVMEYVRGESLSNAIKADGPFDWPRFRSAALQILGAVSTLHDSGIIHRDIKPDNVMLEEGTQRLVLTDFGVISFPEKPDDLTNSIDFLGTPRYAAPEWLFREPPEAADDPMIDVYSLGATFYEMITGVEPFHEIRNKAQLFQAIRQFPLSPGVVKDFPRAVIDLVRQMLAKSPDDRPALGECMRVLGDSTVEKAAETGGSSRDRFRRSMASKGVAALHRDEKDRELRRIRWNQFWIDHIYRLWDHHLRGLGAEEGIANVVNQSSLEAPTWRNRVEFARKFPALRPAFVQSIRVEGRPGVRGVFIVYLFGDMGPMSYAARIPGILDGADEVLRLDLAADWSGPIDKVVEGLAEDVPTAAALLWELLAEANVPTEDAGRIDDRSETGRK